MTVIELIFAFAFAFSWPIGLFTAAWTVLVIAATFKGFPYLWGVAAVGVAGIVTYDSIAVDPPDADWPGVGFVVDSLIAYGFVVFVICLVIASWRRDHADHLVDNSGRTE